MNINDLAVHSKESNTIKIGGVEFSNMKDEKKLCINDIISISDDAYHIRVQGEDLINVNKFEQI